MLTGVDVSSSGYKVWLHENGYDEIDGSSIEPVLSYFETADLSPVTQGINSGYRITRIEPDFIQSGPLTVQVTGRANARAPMVTSAPITFPEEASSPQEQIVVMKEQRRELRVRFESNTLGGDYQMGRIIGHLSPGDKTTIG